MALQEYYVDSSIGTDTGTGTTGDPYGRLSYAFSQNPTATSGTLTRFNVKGTSSGSPETSLGTLPTGAGTSLYTMIAPYITTAGDDDTGFVWMDAGTSLAWNNTALDYMVFYRCAFTGGSGTTGYRKVADLDNNICLIDCKFDGSYMTFDATCSAHRCSYINMQPSGDIFSSTSVSDFSDCYVQITGGTTTGGLILASNASRNIVNVEAGSHTLVFNANANTHRSYQNAVYFDAAVTGSRRAFKADDLTQIENCYVEGGSVAIYKQSSCKSYWSQNNYYKGTTSEEAGDANALNVREPYGDGLTSLASSIFNDPANGDFTLSTAGIDQTGQTFVNSSLGMTEATESVLGPVLERPAGGGGGGGRQGLHSIESGSV